MEENQYVPFGEEWKKEVMKMRKSDIVNLFAKSMIHTTIIPSETLSECRHHVQGIINDFVGGIVTKEEVMEQMKEYTFKLQDIFLKGVKQKLKEEPKFLDQVF